MAGLRQLEAAIASSAEDLIIGLLLNCLPRYIKVLVEVAETGEAQIIIAGTYQWQFPVMVGILVGV